MRTTLNIEDKLIEEASKLTGISEKTALVKLGLETLIAKESSKRLVKLGGTEKYLRPIPRRRETEITGSPALELFHARDKDIETKG